MGLQIRSKSLSSAFGKTLVTTMGITAISFISFVIAARILGTEGRGLLSAALLIGTLAAGLTQFGFANSYVYHYGAGRPFRYLRFLLWSIAVVSFVALALAWGGTRQSTEVKLDQALPRILAIAVSSVGSAT